ncbi:MAG: thiol-disulfide oxidoreductase [Gemmataceae bacterium]|nr:thiol-disulfide oxidoreductase [Gemmataceae bacterium]
MRRGGAGLIAVVLALAGCKGTDPKPGDKKDPAGLAARTKGQGPAWLDESLAKLPGAGTGVPKADSWVHPSDPNFNVAAETRGLLAGKVLDPEGRGAKGVFIRIEPADASPKDRDGAPKGIVTDSAGYFMAKGLPPGRVYNLIAEAKIDGKPLSGTVQTRPPQPNITIALRDDLALPPAGPGGPGGGTGDALPPGLPSAGAGPATFPPPPGDLIPPMGLPRPVPTRPSDGNWGPDPGAQTSPIPATIPSASPPAPTSPIPPPVTTPAVRPESTAGGSPPPWKPPAASVPGPPVPSLPLPPAGSPLPSGVPPAGKQSSRPVVRPGANFTLVDSLERPWDFATSRSGSLVLLDFMTTTCVPCRQVIPILVDLQGRYAADGLQLIGVVCDDAPLRDRTALAAKYQQDHNLNYELYTESGPAPGAVQERFQVPSYPLAVLLNGEGTVLWRGHPGQPGNKAALESAIRRYLAK